MSQQPDQGKPVAGNDEFLHNMFAEFMQIQATNTTPKSKSERTANPEILACEDSNLHAVQAGNLGAAMAGSLPSCL